MVEIAIIREWIAKADEDFEFALVNLKEGKPLVTFKSVYMGPTYLDRAGTFSCVPSLPGWSFLRFIYGGVLPPPAVPLAYAWGQGFPP
jgi:hypothetical protein